MYSKEEAKALRVEFWDRFGGYSGLRRRQKGKPAKWILDRTGVKGLNLKFHIDRHCAQTGFEIETTDMDRRLELFDKLESMKKLLEKSMKGELIWEVDYIRENGKSVSRIYTKLDNVDIYNRDTWPDVFKFFYSNMTKLEAFFEEYRDFLKYG